MFSKHIPEIGILGNWSINNGEVFKILLHQGIWKMRGMEKKAKFRGHEQLNCETNVNVFEREERREALYPFMKERNTDIRPEVPSLDSMCQTCYKDITSVFLHFSPWNE